MRNSKSYNKWLDEGYRLFADQGPDSLTVKMLADLCDLPRTNFYYYFNCKEEFIDTLLKRHLESVENNYVVALQNRVVNYDPDLFYVLKDFKDDHLFAKQLFKNREIEKYNVAYKKGVSLSAETLVPKFKSYLQIDLPDDRIRDLWYTLVDAWYSRLSPDDFSIEAQIRLSQDIVGTVLPLAEKLNGK